MPMGVRMPAYNPAVSVRHMLNHAREACALAGRHSRAELETNRTFAIVLVHLMEITGEASARVSAAFRARYPAIPWQDVADFRNVLIHKFDVIDYDIVWQVTQENLPSLIARLEAVLAAET